MVRTAADLPARGDYKFPVTHTFRRYAASNGDLIGPPGSGGANVTTVGPEIRNPLLSLINFYLPYDRRTLNQWVRYYTRFDPYVGNCIDLHAEFPMSDFRFTGVSDPEVLRAYEEMKEETRLVQFGFESSREYEMLGEMFSFWNWDEDELTWKDYTILNPDLLDIVSINWGAGEAAVYTYDPPQELKDLVRNKDERVLATLQEKLDPAVYENLISGKRIPLDDFNMLSLMRKESPYDPRGTSVVLRALKDLMLKDKLREAQYAIADQQITPAQIWKLGDPANGYMPTDADLADFRTLLEAGRHDQLFTIVTHGAVQLDVVGYTGKIIDISPQMDWIAKQIMVAMFTSDAMITSEGPSYQNAVVAFKVIQGRYQTKRDKTGQAYRNKLFRPFSEARGYWERSQAELQHRVRTDKKKPIVPGMEWNFKLDLTDQTQRNQFIMQLREKNEVAMKLVCEILDLPYEVNKTALKQEEGTVFDPVYQKVREARADKSGMIPNMGEASPMGDLGGTESSGVGGGAVVEGDEFGDEGAAAGGEETFQA